MDYWYAECLPCRWQERYGSQDEAIGAVELHVHAYHAGVRPLERAEKRIGHVQLRSEDALGTQIPSATIDNPGEGAGATVSDSEAPALTSGEPGSSQETNPSAPDEAEIKRVLLWLLSKVG